MLGRIWPIKMEVKGDSGKEISRSKWVGSRVGGPKHSPQCLGHQMPREKFCEVRPRWWRVLNSNTASSGVTSYKGEPLKTSEQGCDLMCAAHLCTLLYAACGNPRTADFFSLVPSVIATYVGGKTSKAKWHNNKTTLIPPSICEAKMSSWEPLVYCELSWKGLFLYKMEKRESPDT